jgi:seryl-tRNA synthetase
MIDIRYIITNRQEVTNRLQKRNLSNIESFLNEAIDLYNKEKAVKTKLETNRNTLNTLTQSFFELTQQSSSEKSEALKTQIHELKEISKQVETELRSCSDKLKELLEKIPNLPNLNVPSGNSTEDNVIVYQDNLGCDLKVHGLPHWELCKKYDIVDFELGNKITGAGFPVYKGKAAKLQRALISFFLDEAEKQGYNEVQPPVLVNRESAYATGQIPDKEGNMYQLKDEELYLIPTAEVPITNIYRNVTVGTDLFPIKHAGYTPCFRRESGSWGKHVRGLNRLHQFDKVELVAITKPEESYNLLEEMRSHVEKLLKKLELPFRVLSLCGGDLSFTSAFTYDLEVFSIAQGMWLEVSSVSNFETYQANRLSLKYIDGNKNKRLLHTLNGSAIALPRVLAAILEKNQSNEGILIPSVLWKYTDFKIIN